MSVEMSGQVNKKNKNNCHLKLGQFVVSKIYTDNLQPNEDIIVSPLTQTELADGWKLILPKKRKISTLHEFNINLVELPKHLWSKLKCYDSKQLYKPPPGLEDSIIEPIENKKIINTKYYSKIIDKIYEYNINYNDSDDIALKLYKELLKINSNTQKIIEFYNILNEIKLKGWLLDYVKLKYIL